MFSSTQEIKLLQTTRKKKLYAFAIQVVFPFHEDLRETEKRGNHERTRPLSRQMCNKEYTEPETGKAAPVLLVTFTCNTIETPMVTICFIYLFLVVYL